MKINKRTAICFGIFFVLFLTTAGNAAAGSERNSAIYEDRIVWQDGSNGSWDIQMYNVSTSTETQITSDEADQQNPDIYGDRIVWQDSRNGGSGDYWDLTGNWDIYMYDISTYKETQITRNGSRQTNPAIYGDKIVWQDDRNGNWDIYMYDISTSTETQITSNVSDQSLPDIYEDRIVWIEEWTIYMYNISTSKETRVTPYFWGLGKEYDGTGDLNHAPFIYGDRIVSSAETSTGNYIIKMYDLSTSAERMIGEVDVDSNNPAIYGDIIVWEDGRNSGPGDGNRDVYMYNLSTSTETQITTNLSRQADPAIYGDRIVWTDERNGNEDIYMYGLSTSEEIRITTSKEEQLEQGTETQITTNNSRQSNPDIYEDRIVWIDWRNGNADIYMYDLFISTETQITNDEADQLNPDIYGDRIVWQDSRNGKSDLYMFNVSTSKETRITTSGSVYYGSEIYGDRIVWMDKRNSGSAPDDGFGGFDVYMYDLSTKKETRITKSTIPDNPDLNVFVDIYDNKIVWGPDMDGSNISVYDLSTSRQENVSSALQLYNIAFSGNRIVGTNNREGREGIVNMYDLSTATETKITSDFSAYGGPDISGNRIVWPDSRNSDLPPDSGSELDLYMYDLSTSTETQITTSKSVAWSTPSIYGDRVVWCDERNGNMDIYMFTLASDEVPELPVADFSANITGGYAPLSVQFTDLSENATEWKWSFGNGATSIEQNPVHTYSAAGTYTVNLTVSNSNGTDSKLATINVSEKNVLDDNETEGTETRITTNTSSQLNPDIYGERIVWQDGRNGSGDYWDPTGNWDIYMYDTFTSTETRITTNESLQINPAIYGDKIVWQDDRNGNSDIYMYNLSSSAETQITTNESNQMWPAIYGDIIVWKDDRNGKSDIYMYDISTFQETQISTRGLVYSGSEGSGPVIYNDRIVWQESYESDFSTHRLVMYDLSTQQETHIAEEYLIMPYSGFYAFAIHGDKIVYNYFPSDDSGIIEMYNLSTQQTTGIGGVISASPDVYGDRIVWVETSWEGDYNASPDYYYNINMYNLSTQQGIQASTSGTAHDPAIYGDRIVWQDDRNGNLDIYMFTLASDEVPAPDDNETNEGNETDDDTEVPDNDSDDGDDTGADNETEVPDNCSELTPLDNMQALKEYVERTYKCHEKTKTGLASLLDKSMCFYEKGEDEKAISMLKSFIHLAERMKECKQISADEADYMVREAKKIIDQMDEGDRTGNGNKVPNNESDNGAGNVTDNVCEETKPVCEPVCEEAKPVCESVCEETKPVCEPVCQETELVSEETKPVCKPVCEETKPVCEPVCEETKPVCEPVCEETKPVCEPVCEETELVSEETKPVCEPVCEETELVSEETKPVCEPVCKETKEALEAEASCEVEEAPAKSLEEIKEPESSCEVEETPAKSPENIKEPEKSCEIEEDPAKSSEEVKESEKSCEVEEDPAKSSEEVKESEKSCEVEEDPAKSPEDKEVSEDK
jgi:beta propeller repeat protein